VGAATPAAASQAISCPNPPSTTTRFAARWDRPGPATERRTTCASGDTSKEGQLDDLPHTVNLWAAVASPSRPLRGHVHYSSRLVFLLGLAREPKDRTGR